VHLYKKDIVYNILTDRSIYSYEQFLPRCIRGATTAEKLEGTKVWVPTPGACAPVLDAGARGCSLPLWGSGVSPPPPGKFLNTQMLNPAFWWLLAVKFGGGGQSPPVPTVVAPMRCMECRRDLAMRKCLSVRLSVKRVHCNKTKERSVQIFMPYKRSFSLAFWEEEWLVGATLLPEILGLPALVRAKSPILNWYCS